MSFLHTEYLFLLAIPLLLGVIAYLRLRTRQRKWGILVQPDHIAELVHTTSPVLRIVSVIFALLALACTIVALARPYQGETETEDTRIARNVIIALDISRSMLTKDVAPSRLERAKTAAYDLMEALPEDNVGIIGFAGESQLLMPISHDHHAAREIIDQLQFGWIEHGGTNMERVIEIANNTFEREKEKDATNALIIITDGEDTIQEDYPNATTAKERGIIILTVGIGTTAGDLIPNPETPDGLFRDRQGKHIVSKLNEASLLKLSDATGGDYIALTAGENMTTFIQKAVGKITAKESKENFRTIPNEQFHLFAIPAILFILLSLVCSSRWRRPQTQLRCIIIALCTILAAPSAHAAPLEKEAQDLIRAEKYKEAATLLETKAKSEKLSRSELAALELALGYTELAQGNSVSANIHFSRALLTDNQLIQAAAHYNMGNTSAQLGFQALQPKQKEHAQVDSDSPPVTDIQSSTQPDTTAQPHKPDKEAKEKAIKLIEQAIEHYDDALSLSDSTPAAINKERLEKFLEILKQPDPEQEKQDKDDKEDDKKDDKKDDKQDQKDKQKDQDKKDDQKDDKKEDKGDKPEDKDRGDKKDDKDNKGDRPDEKKDDRGDKSDDKDKDKEDKGEPDKPEDKDTKDDKKDDKGEPDKPENQKPDNARGDPPPQDGNDPKEGDQDKPQDKPDNPEQKDQEQPAPQPDDQKQKKDAPLPQATVPLSKEERERGEAARILKENTDKSIGNPVPQRRHDPRSIQKDY